MMTHTSLPDAVVLFGHGSRDPAWAGPIEAVAQHMHTLNPATPVRCAYLEWTTPALPEVVQGLHQQGARHLRIVPMFLGIGRHARDDLPAMVDTLRQQYPDMTIELRPAVGEDQRIVQALATCALT